MKRVPMICADVVLVMIVALGASVFSLAIAQNTQPIPPECNQACVQNIMNRLQETRDEYMIDAAREKARADALFKENVQLKADLETAKGEKK